MQIRVKDKLINSIQTALSKTPVVSGTTLAAALPQGYVQDRVQEVISTLDLYIKTGILDKKINTLPIVLTCEPELSRHLPKMFKVANYTVKAKIGYGPHLKENGFRLTLKLKASDANSKKQEYFELVCYGVACDRSLTQRDYEKKWAEHSAGYTKSVETL